MTKKTGSLAQFHACRSMRDLQCRDALDHLCWQRRMGLIAGCPLSSTRLVFATPVWTHTTLPSGDARSIHGRLPCGNVTVLTMLRVAR